MAVAEITFRFDTEQPLGPQILRARERGLPWKFIQELFKAIGLPSSRSWLEELSRAAAAPPDKSVRDTRAIATTH